MEILAAYDLTRSYRDAAKICGVSPNTVRPNVKARPEGLQAPVSRPRGRLPARPGPGPGAGQRRH